MKAWNTGTPSWINHDEEYTTLLRLMSQMVKRFEARSLI